MDRHHGTSWSHPDRSIPAAAFILGWFVFFWALGRGIDPVVGLGIPLGALVFGSVLAWLVARQMR